MEGARMKTKPQGHRLPTTSPHRWAGMAAAVSLALACACTPPGRDAAAIAPAEPAPQQGMGAGASGPAQPTLAVVPADDLYQEADAGGIPDGEAIVDIDFGDHTALVPVTGPRVSGSLPPGIQEDSAWAKVSVEYTPMHDDLGGGLGWVRARIAEHESGRGQLKCPLPPVGEPTDFRLTVTAASPSASPLALSVMDAGQPYRNHWLKPVGLSADRQTHVFEFTLGPLEQPVGLILNLGQAGAIDLFRLTLVRQSPALLRAAMDRAHPDGGPANVLRHSQFPLGLQAGWSVGVNGSLEHDLEVRPRPDIATGRGTVPLQLRTRSGRGLIELSSPPFAIPVAYRKHTLSLFLRGAFSGALRVLGEGKELAAMEIALDDGPEFRRLHLPFQPLIHGRGHILELRGKGDVLVDALMVGPGEAPLPFAPPPQAEIFLAHDPMAANIVFADDPAPPPVACEVRGAWPAGSRLAFRLYNAYGDVGALPDWTLPDGGREFRGTLPPLPVRADRPLGPQRLEASLVGGDGMLLGPVQELVYHLLPRPRHWGKDAPESPFGVHCNVFEPHLHAAKAMGINWLRTHGPNGFLTYWSSVEQRQGSFSFPDRYVQLVRERHLNILGVLAECPGWARITRPQGGAWLDLWWQPRDYAEFGAYVRAIAGHYRGVIDHWQTWNEPWGGFWFKEWDASKEGRDRWSPGPDPLGDYLRLSAVAHAEAKAANPAATVLGINGTAWGGGRGGDWLRRMVAAGGLETCDLPAFHVYHNDSGFFGCPLDPQGFWSRQIEQSIFAPLREADPDRRRAPWMTEGKSSEQQRNTALYRHTVLRRNDALALVREHACLLPVYHAVLFANGVDKVFLYSMEATRFRPADGVDWSVLTTKAGELNVSAAAHAAMTSLLEGKRCRERLALAGGVQGFRFADEDGAQVVLLAALPHVRIARPGIDLPGQWLDLFGNPLAPGEDPPDRVAYVVMR